MSNYSKLSTNNILDNKKTLNIKKNIKPQIIKTINSNKLFLVSPHHFNINIEALDTNKFMSITSNIEEVQKKVFNEHNLLYKTLLQHNFDISYFENTNPNTPDAIFCNNWLSIHHPQETGANNSFGIIYNMAIPNRRKEIRNDVLLHIQKMYGDNFHYKDLSKSLIFENKFLEGTGSIVFDRYNKTMYVSLSKRSYYWVAKTLAKNLNYKLIVFTSNYNYENIYHTNVMMAIGKKWAVVCKDVITTDDYKNRVINNLKESGKEIIEISIIQMINFCGNIIELVNKEGITYTVMSSTAYYNFTDEQKSILGNIIHVPFNTIEKYGGGGVRCCITEI